MQNQNETKKQVPHFIATGNFSDDEFIRYQDMIKFLGGKIIPCKKEQFIISCTHIIVFSFSSSVKVMCGLASGKWLIDKEYIIQSYKKRKWLNEEDYEVNHFRNIAKYHRLRTAKLYENLTVYVGSNDVFRKKSLARVLSAGGAIIHNQKDLEDGCKIDFALTNEELLESVKSVVGKTTPILDMTYIKDTIFSKHQPKNIKRFILNNTTAIIESKFKNKKNNNARSDRIANPPETPRVIIKTEVPNGYKRLINDYMISDKESSSSVKKHKPSSSDSSGDIEIIAEYCDKGSKSVDSKCLVTQSSDKEETGANKESQDLILLDPEKEKEPISKAPQNLASDICVQNTIKENDSLKSGEISNNSVFRSNLMKLTSVKRVIIPVDLPRMSKLVSIFLGCMNTSQDYLNFFHIPVYDYPVGEVREIDHRETIFTASCSDEEKIVSKRVGRHNINVIERNEDSENFAENDIQYICDALQYLRMKIQPDIIPNADNIGTMLRQHILRSPARSTSDMALNIFKSLINLHPPHDKKMRNYYWDIFQRTFPDAKRTFSKFKGWHFVEVWLKDLFKGNPEDINYDVIVMVDDILQLFELDLVQYNEKPISVRSLLSYRLFWVDLYQNPSIVNYEVKGLIQMWIRSSKESNQVLNKITRFLCLMLEMLWKWSNIENFFDLSTWPMHSSFMPLANEFLRQFQDVNAETLLKLVKAIPVPWHQLYLGSLAYRSKIDKSELDVELTFPYLKSKLCEECNLCTKEEKNEEFPHVLRIKFLTLLTVSYAHAMGVTFCKSELRHHFNRSIREKEIISPPTEKLNDLPSLNKESTVPSSSEALNNNNNNTKERKEENLVIKKVVGKIMKLLGNMSGYINELNKSKAHCSHISDFNFNKSL